MNGLPDKTLLFFDIRKCEFVDVPLRFVKKKVVTNRHGETRYALRGMITDGQTATKFLTKEDWNAVNAPIVD